MQFSALGLAEPILRAVASEGYVTATPIQAQAIPHALEGRDVLGCAQTGTGKTAAFALPILHRLTATPRQHGAGKSRCLVLCPTRELVTQTAEAFRVYGKNLKLRQTTIYGGVGQNPQVYAMRQGVDIVVATPGRLLDLMDQGHADLRGIEMLVLDEADRMLDMGFINDIRKIVSKIPATRQTLFFSATMPPEIRGLADALLRDAVNIQVAPVATTAANVQETLYFVSRGDKPNLLAHLYNDLPMARTIVFTRTRRGADKVVKRLHASGIRAEAIHGDKTQSARERALHSFRSNKMPILVATDIASRGIDVDGITHVVNFDLTHEPDTYVHRIGRTARAGASGVAVSFCDLEEVPNLRAIEKLIRRPVPVVEEHPYVSQEAANAAARRPGGAGRSAGGRHQGRPSQSGHGDQARPVHVNPPQARPIQPKPQHPLAAIARPAAEKPARDHADGHATPKHARPVHVAHGHAKPAHAAHVTSKPAHAPSKPSHAPSKSAHAPSKAAHAPAKTAQTPSRSAHAPARSAHAPAGRPTHQSSRPTGHSHKAGGRQGGHKANSTPGRGAVVHRGPASRKRGH